MRSNVINLGKWQSKTLLPGLSRGPMSSILRGCSRKPHWQDVVDVQCLRFRTVVVENPIPRTLSTSNVIDSGRWQSKFPLAGLSRGRMSLFQDGGSRKPHCKDILEVQCQSIPRSGSQKPYCQDFLELQSHQFGAAAVKTPLPGLSPGAMSSIQGGVS